MAKKKATSIRKDARGAIVSEHRGPNQRGRPKSDTEWVSFLCRLKPDEMNDLRLAADENCRSLSAHVRWSLLQQLKKG